MIALRTGRSAGRTAEEDNQTPGGGGAFPGYYALTPEPVGAGSVGAAATVSRGDHSHPVIEVATVAALALVDCGAMNNGTRAYVDTLKSVFELVATTRATQTTSVVAALNKAASRWCRVLARNLAWEVEPSWFIDPTNGNDEASGITSATALRSLAELNRRWYNATIAQNVALTVLGNIAPTDINRWTFHVAPGFLVTLTGSLGPTTGFGGAAINNQLFPGVGNSTVTGFVAASNTPAADDIEMTDAAVPVSFTASGMMASGVIFRRNSGGAVVHWYADKDLGAKSIRIKSPNGNTVASTYQTLNVGDGYAAYTMWQIPSQFWGPSAGQVLCDTLYDVSTTAENSGFQTPRRRRIWLGTQTTVRGWGFGGWINCMLEIAAANTALVNGFQSLGSTTGFIGGGARGGGNSILALLRDCVMLGCPIFQGVQVQANDGILLAFETAWAQHDCSVTMLVGTNAARITTATSNAGAGLSGKGNTGKILLLSVGAALSYTLSGATPPFIAGVTTDATPITLGGTSYAVAAIPAVTNTTLVGSTHFP